MNGVITDARTFHKARPNQTAEPIPIRYVSEEPRKRLFRLYMWVESTMEEMHNFYFYSPWVHYEWAYVPHLSEDRPWLMNGMYFSPTPLCSSLYVSKPCLPNFYETIPCCSDEMNFLQEDWEDSTFINSFWSEVFNLDGDLLEYRHSAWQSLIYRSEVDDDNSPENIKEIFTTWENLSLHDVLSLNWPQNLCLPNDGRKL